MNSKVGMVFWCMSSWKTSENSCIRASKVISINWQSLSRSILFWNSVCKSASLSNSLMFPTWRFRIPHGTIQLNGVRSVVTLSANPWNVIHLDTLIPMAANFWFPAKGKQREITQEIGNVLKKRKGKMSNSELLNIAY